MRERVKGIFKALSEKHAAKDPLSSRLSFRIDGDIRTFQNHQTLTKFVNTKLALQEILRGGSIKVKRPEE